MENRSLKPDATGLIPYLSPLGAWALAFGCAVGWGAFVMPGTTFLPIAGPVGTVIGLVIGAGIMLIIGANYQVLMNRCPGSGGAYSFARDTLGSDHGFLCAWMLILTYSAIIWANSTALALITRYLFGNIFCFGFSYTVAGYTIYMGELLLSITAIIVTALIVALSKRLSVIIQIVCALLTFVGICVTFVAVVIHRGGFSAVLPAGSQQHHPVIQILGIVIFAPWAFIGFESISHSAREFRFSVKKSMPIMVAAVVTGLLSYSMLTICAALAVPDGYADWVDYIADLTRLDGAIGLPTFYSAQQALGSFGLIMLAVAALGAIITALVGYYTALSRLFFAMGRDHLMHKPFSKLNKHNVPSFAIICVAIVSCIIPLFGRTAIGWIVDVTSIGATVVYAYVSISAFVVGIREKRVMKKICGGGGAVISIVFIGVYILQHTWSYTRLATESYLILIIWCMLGMLVFRIVLQADKSRTMGKHQIVWIVLLFLMILLYTVWIQQTTSNEATNITREVTAVYTEEAQKAGLDPNSDLVRRAANYFGDQINVFGSHIRTSIYVQVALVLASLGIIFSMFSVIRKREKEIEEQRMRAEESSRAKSLFLANMSHDIRTPMNAITGYTALALKQEDMGDQTREYLQKIDNSSHHLLGLINDILDMSRIESGKMELDPEPANLLDMLYELDCIFSEQMAQKSLTYTVDGSSVEHPHVICDKNRLNRVLMNLVSNAYKFTPKGGSVTVALREIAIGSGSSDYEFTVADTGIGISKEFQEHIFDAFERERSSTVSNIQGTGLGMAITKNLVDLMNGTVTLDSEPNKGSTFTIRVSFEHAQEALQAEEEAASKERDFTGVRILLAEDNPINSEIACALLSGFGFRIDVAENGQHAVELMAASPAGTYKAILMDIQMPVMNGYDAARAIRALPGGRNTVPIIAVTANSFEEDRKAAIDAGMNDHVSKPFAPDKLLATLSKWIEDDPETP